MRANARVLYRVPRSLPLLPAYLCLRRATRGSDCPSLLLENPWPSDAARRGRRRLPLTPHVRYYYLRCSVLLVRGVSCLSVVSVVCLCQQFLGQNATITRASTFRHRRPFTSSQGVSTAEGIIHKQIGSRVTPNMLAVGNISGPESTALNRVSSIAMRNTWEPRTGRTPEFAVWHAGKSIAHTPPDRRHLLKPPRRDSPGPGGGGGGVRNNL